MFIVSKFDPETGAPTAGYRAGRKIEKLGYKGIDSAELIFENVELDAARHLVGGIEGQGFYMAVGGLELGRINVAARAVGLARRALHESVAYSQQRRTFGKPICEHQAIQLKLGEMASKVRASELLVADAAASYDRGARCDMEAGMGKSILLPKRPSKSRWRPCAFSVATVTARNIRSSGCIGMRR